MVKVLSELVEELTRLLQVATFFDSQCEALLKFLEIFKVYIFPKTKAEENFTLRSPNFDKLNKYPEVTLAVEESLRRLILFFNLYAKPTSLNTSYEILRYCWVILNSTSLHKNLCKKVRHAYSLVGPLLKSKHRRAYEELSRKYIVKPISRSLLIQKFDLVAQKLNKSNDINKLICDSLNAFFWGLNKRLKRKTSGYICENIINIEKENLLMDIDDLVVAIEYALLDQLNIRSAKETTLFECKQQLKGNLVGPLIFQGSPMILGKMKSRDDYGTPQIFEAIQEVALLRAAVGENMLFPTKYIHSDNLFFLVYQDVKFPLSSMVCNNKKHPLYDFTPLEALVIIKHVVSGLVELHDLGFVYNSISIENVLLCIHRGSDRQKFTNVKLSGFSIFQGPGIELDDNKRADDLTILEDLISQSPEVHLDLENSTKNDIFSVSMLLWRLVHFKKDLVSALLQTMNLTKTKDQQIILQLSTKNAIRNFPMVVMKRKVKQALIQGLRPRVSHMNYTRIREAIIGCITKCWALEASSRPSAVSLLEDINGMISSQMPDSYDDARVLNGLNDNLRNGENDELKQLTKHEKLPSEVFFENLATFSEEDGTESVVTHRSETSTNYHQSSKISRMGRQTKGTLLRRNFTLRSIGSKSDIPDGNTIAGGGKTLTRGLRKITSKNRFSKKRLFPAKSGRRKLIGEIERDADDDCDLDDQEEVDRSLFQQMESDLNQRSSVYAREQISTINPEKVQDSVVLD